jgi:hypothetical protein
MPFFQRREKMNTVKFSIQYVSCLVLVSIILLAACAPFSPAPLTMTELHLVEKSSATGIESRNQFGDDDVLRNWELSLEDISAAREAANVLSKTFTLGKDYGQDLTLRTWELDVADIAAAREAAEILSQINMNLVDYGEDDVLREWEIGIKDIEAARAAAQALSQFALVSFGK